VCGGWTVKNPVNAKPRPRLAQVLEETPAAAEQRGCQGDFQLVDDTQVQVLLDHVRSTRDTNITAAASTPGRPKNAAQLNAMASFSESVNETSAPNSSNTFAAAA
jgi:hypothetical protein